jgi:parvulin-like peptidyl-prolyl isomerase
MAWQRWLGAGVIGLGSWLLTGCASELPWWAQPPQSLSSDLSRPAQTSLIRSQTPDTPMVTLPKPGETPLVTLPNPNLKEGPPLVTLQKPASAAITVPTTLAPNDPGVVQSSMANRGRLRVHVRAWVNGRPIFDDEVMEVAGPELRRASSPEKQAEIYNFVLEQIVDQELLYQDAVRRLEKVSKHSLAKMREYVDQEFDKSVQKMRAANVSEEDIRRMEPTARRMLERNLISQEYARSQIKPVVDSHLNLSEVGDYYEAHKSEFMRVDKVVWQDIFIPLGQNLPTVEDAKRFGEDLINRCRRPEHFDQLMQYNEGESKLRGGEGLGQRRGEIRPAELEETLFKLGEGQIGPVVAFSTGVHLVRVTKREYAGQMPLDDQVAKVIRKKLESQLADREYRRIVRELRTRAVVRLER